MLLGCLPYFSHSEEIFESTPNVVATGRTWNMQNILPAETGLVVNGIAWRYAVDKNAADAFQVNIEQNAINGSNLFTFTDNWTGLPGNNITRGAPLNLLGENMGMGALTTDGFGTVSNENIIYTYQYDPCLDPTPGCPNYIPPAPVVEVPSVDYSFEEMQALRDQNQEDLERQQMMKERKERAREAGSNAVSQATLATQFFALDIVPASYYVTLEGGDIQDSFLPGKDISDNRQGRRMGFAQQRLHEEMVNAQYEEK